MELDSWCRNGEKDVVDYERRWIGEWLSNGVEYKLVVV